MGFFARKLLPELLMPFGVGVLLICWGTSRKRPRVVWGGIALLILFSQPLVGRALLGLTEAGLERRPVTEVAAADAIVVLSGGRSTAPGPGRVSEWNDANRFFGGIDLLRADRARWLVFTGGWVPFEPLAEPEGTVLAREAIRMGMPPDRILVSGIASTTEEETLAVRQLLQERVSGKPRIVLVTSAFHMRRAVSLFERAGFDVDPFPVDFAVSAGAAVTAASFFPAAGALWQSHQALRELYGRAYYWIRARLSR